MKKVKAAIDIGSNSVQFLIGECVDTTIIELEREHFITGLGQSVDQTKMLNAMAMKETLEAIGECRKIIDRYNINPEAVIVTATEACRVTKNNLQFIHEIKNKFNLNCQVINSDGEAYYSALGVASGIVFHQNKLSSTPPINADLSNKIIIVDLGGASSEIIAIEVNPFKFISSISLPVGSVRMTDWLREGSWPKFKQEILQNFATHLPRYQCEQLYCVAGTMTSIANMHLGFKDFTEQKVDQHICPVDEFLALAHKTKNYTTEQLLKEFPFLQKRAKAILGGIATCAFIIEQLRPKNLITSTKGLVHGLLLTSAIKNEYIFKF